MPQNDLKESANKPAAKRAAAGSPAKSSLREQARKFLENLKAPAVPRGASCFPVDSATDTSALHRELVEELDRIRRNAEGDPYTNPIQLLVLDISNRLASGKLSHSAVEALIQRLTFSAYAARADHLKRYLGVCGADANVDTIKALIRGLADRGNVVWGGSKAKDRKPGLVSFDSFKQRIELELFGVVFTGHPTFGLTGNLMRRLAELASDSDAEGKPLSPDRRAAIFDEAIASEHRPEDERRKLQGYEYAVAHAYGEAGRCEDAKRHFHNQCSISSPAVVDACANGLLGSTACGKHP